MISRALAPLCGALLLHACSSGPVPEPRVLSSGDEAAEVVDWLDDQVVSSFDLPTLQRSTSRELQHPRRYGSRRSNRRRSRDPIPQDSGFVSIGLGVGQLEFEADDSEVDDVTPALDFKAGYVSDSGFTGSVRIFGTGSLGDLGDADGAGWMFRLWPHLGWTLGATESTSLALRVGPEYLYTGFGDSFGAEYDGFGLALGAGVTTNLSREYQSNRLLLFADAAFGFGSGDIEVFTPRSDAEFDGEHTSLDLALGLGAGLGNDDQIRASVVYRAIDAELSDFGDADASSTWLGLMFEYVANIKSY